MQIFWPENSYTLSAQALDDKRLNKQIIELGQILSTAIWIEDCSEAETLYANELIYLPAYENHPVVKNCKNYFISGVVYLSELIVEYKHRFNKTHSLFQTCATLFNHSHLFKKYLQTGFQNHTTNHKHITDINSAYRMCLIEKWQNAKTAPKWTKRNPPVDL